MSKEKQFEEILKRIIVNAANFDHISKTGIINGTLRSEIYKAMNEAHTLGAQESKWISVETENKRLKELLTLVLDIDFMTTKEFCDTYRAEHPAYRGSIDLAVMEMFAIDSHKWHLIKDKAKEIRKLPLHVKVSETEVCLSCGGEFDNRLQKQFGICGKCLKPDKK